MTTIGFRNIPFVVDITMHAAVHSDHQVHLFANDPRLTFPAGGTAMTFTPANWNVAQHITVNFDGVGDAELLAAVTNDYFVDGAGHHRVKTDIIDLSVTALPLDTWVGSVPVWVDGGLGDLSISHNNVLVGHVASIGIPAWTGIGSDTPFVRASNCTVLVDLPDGSHSSYAFTLGSAPAYSMNQLGVYRFRIAMEPCWIQNGLNPGYTIQASDFTFTVLTAVGGTVLAGPVTKSAVKSQGFATAAGNTGLSVIESPRQPDGPFSVTVPAVVLENTFLGSVSFQGGGGIMQSNCTGGAVSGSGATVMISGMRVNFPLFVSLDRTGIEVHVDGADTGIRFGAGYNN